MTQVLEKNECTCSTFEEAQSLAGYLFNERFPQKERLVVLEETREHIGHCSVCRMYFDKVLTGANF